MPRVDVKAILADPVRRRNLLKGATRFIIEATTEGRDRGMNQEYLGDSVYVETEPDGLKLTTNNGYPDDPRNVIYLEWEVLDRFLDYLIEHGMRLGGMRSRGEVADGG